MISAAAAGSGTSVSRPIASTIRTSAKGGGASKVRLQPSASRSSRVAVASETSEVGADDPAASFNSRRFALGQILEHHGSGHARGLDHDRGDRVAGPAPERRPYGARARSVADRGHRLDDVRDGARGRAAGRRERRLDRASAGGRHPRADDLDPTATLVVQVAARGGGREPADRRLRQGLVAIEEEADGRLARERVRFARKALDERDLVMEGEDRDQGADRLAEIKFVALTRRRPSVAQTPDKRPLRYRRKPPHRASVPSPRAPRRRCRFRRRQTAVRA